MNFRAGVIFILVVAFGAFGQENAVAPTAATRDLSVTVGKSVLVDSPQVIERISVANGDLAEAVAVTPHEILVNGKVPGETSMIVWQQGGNRLFFDLLVNRSETRVDGVRRQIAQETGDQMITVEMVGDTVFLRGVARNLTSAQRAVEIASTLGKTVNLLRVDIPPTDTQILLKVKFADVDRAATKNLGINIFSTGNNVGSLTTGQFSPPTVTPNVGTTGTSGSSTLTLSQALEVFLFRPSLNLGATIAALQNDNLLEILAQPNVLAINGKTASFLAGGQFPFPTLQGGGAGLGAVTIQFKEFGVRLNFTPTITPRGTIRLQVTPEVSSLDYADGLVYNGTTVPALSVRRVSTEIELDDGQTFAIGGLLDNRDTETFNKIPGLGDIPFFGNLFRSRSKVKSNTELLVMVTPEIVRPIPKDQPLPDLKMPGSFLPPNTSPNAPQSPGLSVTGPVPVKPPRPTVPVEDLIKSQQAEAQQQMQPDAQAPQLQFVPMLVQPSANGPATAQPAPAAAPTPAAPPTQ